jgi:hypothetical protein
LKNGTKITIGGGVAGLALAAMLLKQTPCDVPKVAYGGDKVGSQCQVVPEGQKYRLVAETSWPDCIKNANNSSLPCKLSVDDKIVLVFPCFTELPNGHAGYDQTCSFDRIRYAEK